MRAFLLTTFAALLLAGCSASGDAPATRSGVATVTLQHLGALDTARGQYVLWLRTNKAWQPYALSSTTDSTIYRAAISNVIAIDSAKLSIKGRSLPSTAVSVIAAAAFSGARASLKSTNAIPDLSQATAIATFATSASDTNRAKHEVYLMQMGNGDRQASIENLPAPPPGWRYAIWVINTNFIPSQNLFFGSFSAQTGASPDALATSFAFPGGYYPGDFLSEGASVSVTLEPVANLTLHPRRPSSLEIMSGQLHRFINMNDTVALENVWSVPSAQLVIQ
jgi:hypothetical protein